VRIAGLAGLVGSLALLGPASVATAAPTVVGSIPFSGGEPLAVAVYEAGNKVFVTEDNAGKLYIFDGATHQVLNTIDVGGAAFDLTVNETHGKVYVGSNKGCCTTGITEGNGLISVVDADTNQLITQFNPGDQGNDSKFTLANDEVADRVYLAFHSGIGVIDPATDQFTMLTPPEPITPWVPTKVVVNTVTHTAYIDDYGRNRLVTVDGATGAVGFLDLAPSGGRGPLDIEVNERENKVYATMIQVPGQAEIGILIHDRDTGTFKFVGEEDLEPLAFNPSTNRLFTGVQVGQQGAIVDGATDQLTMLDFDDEGGFGAIDVRTSTDNAYMASSQITQAVNGGAACAVRFNTAPDLGGGVVVSSVAVNEATGRVYVNNRHQAGKLTVFQDDGPACAAAPGDTAVDFVLRAPNPQRPFRRGGVAVRVRCLGEDCGVKATGHVTVPVVASGAVTKRFRLRAATGRLFADQLSELRLRLTSKLSRRLEAAFRHPRARKRVRAKVTVAATDAARNTTTKSVSVRLRR
jgi:DNA-binding beta-propeller fold protein YncE